MKLRKPCQHGRYEKHEMRWLPDCPGGVFLPDDTELQRRIAEVLDAWAPDLNDYAVEKFTDEILAALDRETP